MRRTVAGLFVLLLVLAACAQPGGSPPASVEPSSEASPGSSSSPPPPPSAGTGGDVDHPAGSEAVIAITQTGGMLPVHMQATMTPVFVLTGDGRAIVQGAQTLEFPGPILPPLQERQLTEEGVQTILGSLEETGLFVGDLELRGMQNVLADASDTVFTVNAGGRTSVVTVYAIGPLPPDMPPPPGVDDAELEAHAVLSLLHDGLLTLDTWLPADAWATDSWVPYEPEAMRLYVRDVTDEPIDDLPGQERAWPTDDDPAAFGEELPAFGDGTRCAAVEGEDAALWFTELSNANENTIWTSDDRRYAIDARPLMPHEPVTCEA
jgi:hypothetical protein